MTRVHDLDLDDGRVLRVHDTGGGARGTVLWHHGSPQTGAPLAPLLRETAARGLRLVSYGRPAYGGSSPQPGRTVAGAAGDVRQLADALGLERFAVLGASGGGPHALACAALLPGRVTAAVCLAGLAPYDGTDDWFAGMADDRGLRAALEGRQAKVHFEETAEFDEGVFTAEDHAALQGDWASLGADAGAAGRAGPDGLVDDDLAFVQPWGVDLGGVDVPVLLVQGGADRVVPRAHAERQLAALPQGELWLRPRDGHISVLAGLPVALDWVVAAG